MTVAFDHDTKLVVSKQSGGMFVVRDAEACPGRTFWVGSNVTGATDGAGYGRNPGSPLATLDYALGTGFALADRGDTIFLMPGHNEGKGDAQWDIDVAGVSVIGLGRGTLRPILDFDHANASMNIGASNCRVKNVVLRPSTTAVLIGIDIETTVTDTLLEDIEVIPGEDGAGADEFVTGIETKATCTRTHIKGFKYSHHASAAGANQAIHINGVSDRVHIEKFWIEISGAGAVAGIAGTGNSTRALIENGKITTDAEPGIEVAAAMTGIIDTVKIFADLATIDAATVAAGMAHFDVKYCEVGDEAGTLVKTESIDD